MRADSLTVGKSYLMRNQNRNSTNRPDTLAQVLSEVKHNHLFY